jgi:uncharacterized membrane protein
MSALLDHAAETADASRHQFERLVFFSDAVFAIAITLLVLDLRLPPEAQGNLDLESLAPKLIGFALSFFVIGLYWLNHHRLFGELAREDGPLRIVNLIFLASVVFLPFPTSIIAQSHATSATVAFYAGSVAAVGIMMTILTLVAARSTLIRPDRTPQRVRRSIAFSLATPLIFLVSIAIAYRSPHWAMRSWFLIALLGPSRRLARRRRSPDRKEPTA